MFRKVLWVTILLTSLAMFGQVQQAPTAAPGSAGAQVYQTPVYVPVPSPVVGGYYTGYYGGYGGYYGMTTPSATFASPQPTAGISLADRAGISTSTPISTGVQSTLAPTTLVYTNVQPVGPPEAEAAAVPVAVSPAAALSSLGPSYFAGSGPVNPNPEPIAAISLGEVAAQYKSRGPQNVRTFTNADVEQLNANRKVGGLDVTARMGAPPGSAPAQAAAQPSAGARPAPAVPAGTQAQSTQPTTPQVGQPQPAEQAPRKELPATATVLPLLGILGLAGGGIGLIVRRYRK